MRYEPTTTESTLRQVRGALWLVTVGTCLGAYAELASLQHWNKTQLIAWVIVSIVLVGAIVVAFVRNNVGRWIARGTGLVGIIGAAIGVWEHIEQNMETAPLAAKWSKRWDKLSALEQFWFAASGQAGPNPPLAPGMLALAGVLLILLTWGAWTSKSTKAGGITSRIRI